MKAVKANCQWLDEDKICAITGEKCEVEARDCVNYEEKGEGE